MPKGIPVYNIIFAGKCESWFVFVGQVSDPTKGMYGAGAHSDYGLVTLLATDCVSGLQVCTFKSIPL